METFNIQELWKRNEEVLQKTHQINIALLRELKLDKAKSNLKSLSWWSISTLIFYMGMATYGMFFMVQHWGVWYFMLGGGVVTFFSIWFVIASSIQLSRIYAVNYEDPILKLQRDISNIKPAMITNLKIVAYLIPFGPFIGIFVIKAVFGVDVVTVLDGKMMISFSITSIVLEILSLVLVRKLNAKNSHTKWMNWLLRGNGSQVDEALKFIKQLEDFEQEN